MDWKEIARRGLEATSIKDSSLGELVGALKIPELDSHQLCQGLDTPAILAFIQSRAVQMLLPGYI